MSRKRLYPLVAASLLGACASGTDFGPDAVRFSDATASAIAAARPVIAPAAQAQARAIRAARIANGLEVLDVTADCAELAFPVDPIPVDACRLLRFSDTDELPAPPPDDKLKLLRVLDAVAAYAESLRALATSKTPAAIGAATKELSTALGTLSETVGPQGNSASTRFTAAAGPAGAIATAVAQQFQARALRRAVEAGQEPLETALKLVMTHLRELRPELDTSYDALESAERAMDAARQSGNAAAHAQAVARVEQAHSRFIAAQRSTPIPALNTVILAHRSLAEALQRPGDPEALIALAENLKALTQALED